MNDRIVEFQSRVLERPGIGNETHLPVEMALLPWDKSLISTLSEVGTGLFPAVHELFNKHKMNQKMLIPSSQTAASPAQE